MADDTARAIDNVIIKNLLHRLDEVKKAIISHDDISDASKKDLLEVLDPKRYR